MSWRWMLVPVLCASVWAADRPAIPAKLTLQDAMSLAFRSSTALRRAAALVQQSQGQAVQARSGLLPQVGVTASDSLQTTNPSAMGLDIPFLPGRVGPFESVDARASLSQNLINIPVRDRNRAGNAMVSAAMAQRDNARELLAFQVATGFAQAVRALAAVATLTEQVALSRRLSQIAQDRYEGGVASALELKRSQQQVNNLEQSLDEAQNQMTSAKLSLANLLHAEVTAEYELVPEAADNAPLPSHDEAMSAALAARADYRAVQAQVKAAEYRVAAAKAERYPLLQFQADYGQSGRKPFDNLNTFHVRGVLQIPVFTGGRIAGEKVEAEGRLDEARAALDEIQSQVETDVLSALSAETSARKQVEVAAGNVGLARDEVDLATARFTSGAADNTEVVNAQDRLSRAEDNLVRAQFALAVARAQMARATGSAEKSLGATQQ